MLSVASDGAVITVTAEMTEPGPACGVFDSLTKPFHIVVADSMPGIAELTTRQRVLVC